jgi:hypothetical protein
MAIQSYNYFIDYINDNFASPHQQIKRFEEGFYDDFGVWCTDNTDWGMMYIVPQNVRHLQNSVSEYNLRVYFIDQLEKDDSNEREVLSDQLSISRDFINWLHLNDENGYILTNTPNAVPFKSIVMDYTAGWYMDVSVEVETEGSDCSIPFSGASTGYTICPMSYVVNSDNSYNVTLDSGDTLILPNITISSTGTGFTTTYPAVKDYTIPDVSWTDSDGSAMSTEYGEPIVCQPVSPADVEINGVYFSAVTAGGELNIPIINGGANPVGVIQGSNFVIGNNSTFINSTQVTDQEAEVDANIFVTRDGVSGGTWNPFTQTWEVTSASSNLSINGVQSEIISGGTTFNLNATLDGVTGGTYNAATDTLSFTSATGWIRDPNWMVMPTLTASDERLYALVLVFENRYNIVGVTFNSTSANINWGDGTSVISNGGLRTKVYDYASLSGTINVSPSGENYKQALIDVTRVGVTISSMDWMTLTSVNYYGGNNIVDMNFSLPSLTTCNLSLDPLSGSKGMTMLQRLRIWSVGTIASQFFRGLKSLRVVQFPAIFQGALTNAFLNGGEVADCGDINFGTSTSVVNFWSGSGLNKHGNYTANSVVGNGVNYAAYCSHLTKFGTINATSQTSFDSFFYENFTLGSIGLITAPSATNLTSMFFRCTILGSVQFANCAAVTTTASIFGNCVGLFDCVMPNLTRGVSFAGTAMGNYGMGRFANSIGTASGAQTITITGTPFGALVTAGDATALAIRLVMTGKGYTIVN